MENFEILRPVGRLEQYSTSRHQVGFYLNVAMSATYVLPDTFVLPIKDYVYQACEAAIAQHPSLSAIVADDHTQDPYFVRLPRINLDQVVSFRDRKPGLLGIEANGEPAPDLDLQTLLATQHNTPFKTPSAFWRLGILLDTENERQFTAAFVYHQAIGDGISGKAFHHTFLQALGTIDSSEQTKAIIVPPSIPLLPNVELMHSQSLSFPYLAKKMFHAKVFSRHPSGLWTGSKILGPSQTRLRLVPFSKLLMATAKARCRMEDTTITALLQVIVARSIFAHIPAHFTRLVCSGTVSCRRWLPAINDEAMGVWFQDYEESYCRAAVWPSDDSFPWAETKRSRKTIQSVLNMKGRNASSSLLQFVDDYQHELCLSRIGKERDRSFEVSNVGEMVPQTDPQMPSIDGLVFSQCASVMGSAIEVSVATGCDGCMVLAISWQQGVVEAGLINETVESIKQDMYSLEDV
ncbi:uncharacterized protein N7515_002347 [Penicillium bovifimosum]|uniref:Alcohol acetyltransferase n=1 Tax=Penicillium bovifimosum TaxID=126998 RepID=A0A9W9HC20_9EURO|nr:uncharacterized protein N7515_002347 [Penicillium bovifimosum]KAJ5143560.1 hypothetical protein N7515_002347 [Penicillium bovifimosum]